MYTDKLVDVKVKVFTVHSVIVVFSVCNLLIYQRHIVLFTLVLESDNS